MLSATAIGALAAGLPSKPGRADEVAAKRRAGRLKQSASRWCYGKIPLGELCVAAKNIGLKGIDLLQQSDWNFVRDHGLTCSMGYAADRADFLTNGFINRASHPMLIRELQNAIPVAKASGVPNLIAMFGNREGRSDAV